MSISYYDDNAFDFFIDTFTLDMSHLYSTFLNLIPDGGRILDVGCGSGRDSLSFASMGYEVTGFDGSEEMVKLARTATTLPILHCQFHEFDSKQHFDGIWACASLLHVPAAELGATLSHLASFLRTQGVFYLSVKLGQGESVVGQRLFTNQDIRSLESIIEPLPLDFLICWLTGDVRSGNKQQWLNVILKKR